MKNIFKNKKIALCVCGSISAYKSVDLASKWVQQGADVKVLMTKSAQKFVGKATFEGITHNKVVDDLWNNESDLNIIAAAKSTIEDTIVNFENLKIHDAIETIMKLLRSLNKYLEINEPWKILKKDPKNRKAANSIYVSINALYVGTQLLHPIMPRKTTEISNVLGIEKITKLNRKFDILSPGTQIGEANSPFPRIQ